MFLNGLRKSEKEAFYALAKHLVAADRIFDESERELMDQFLDEMDVEEDQLEAMTAEAALESLNESPTSVKKQIYIELIGLSLCDESGDEGEKETLKNIAERFGLSEETASKLSESVIDLMAVYQRMGELVSEED